jgi:hypothetical protein
MAYETKIAIEGTASAACGCEQGKEGNREREREKNSKRDLSYNIRELNQDSNPVSRDIKIYRI